MKNKINRVAYLKHYAYNAYGEKISLPQKLRRTWIDEDKSDNNTIQSIYIICGEFSSTDTVEYALSKNINVNVICGAHMFSDESRKKVAELKDKYESLLHVSIYSQGFDMRPPYHSALIGHNVFFENKHSANRNDPSTEYSVAKVIENIDDELKNRYLAKFNEYLQNCKDKDVSAGYIRDMEVLKEMKQV